MSNYDVKNVVCDYGLYEDDNLALICNSRRNAFLIKAIMEKDSGSQYDSCEFTDEYYKLFTSECMRMRKPSNS